MATAEQYADWLVRNADKKGTPEFETVAQAYRQVRAQPEPSAAEKAGATLREIPRQVGLTARYALEGLPAIVEPVTEPLRQYVTDPILRRMFPLTTTDLIEGKTNEGRRSKSASQIGSSVADFIGLPTPRDANERVVGDATRMGFGAMGMSGAAKNMANATSGATRNVLQALAANPGTQATAAATAGASGGAVREAGGGPLEQLGASLLGGVAGGYGANKLESLVDAGGNAARAVRNWAAGGRSAGELARADQQIQLVLGRSGIDWGAVPERVKQGMREEVAAALSTGGELSGDAVRRLLAFKATGTTPTIGMLTQNPGQITREMNLAKTGANSLDPSLQRLPALQNQNTSRLLQNLDEAGAARAPDAMGAGKVAVSSLKGKEAAATGEIDRLYKAARDTSGRSLPLEGGTFTTRANQLLDQENVGSFLTPDIANKMNAIAAGKLPLTVDVAEQLKTSIGALQRGTNDGNVRKALGLVRQALDEAPLQGSGGLGTQPAVAGAVPTSPLQVGQESIEAFKAARAANRAWMQRVEGNPALKAVVDGVEPDQFMQKFVVGNGASAADVRGLVKELGPEATNSIKQYLVRHLRDAATNSTDDITKFSNDGYRRALRSIGDEKLAAFFTREELQQLKDIGAAAKYMQAQPAGTAVNNSNSGALVLGRGMDMLGAASNYMPLGLKDVIQGRIQSAQQSAVLAPRNALAVLADVDTTPRLNPLLAAAIASPVQASEDKRRQKPTKPNRVNP